MEVPRLFIGLVLTFVFESELLDFWRLSSFFLSSKNSIAFCVELAGSFRMGGLCFFEVEKMPEGFPEFFRSFLLVRERAECERAAEGVSEMESLGCVGLLEGLDLLSASLFLASRLLRI